MNYLIVYLVYSAIGLALALVAVRVTQKYIPSDDQRILAGVTFFLWPFVVLFTIVMLIIDREPPCGRP